MVGKPVPDEPAGTVRLPGQPGSAGAPSGGT